MNEYSKSVYARKYLTINKTFTQLFGNAWIKDAEIEENEDAWIGMMYEDNINPDFIDQALDEVKKSRSFNQYPPNLNNFRRIYLDFKIKHLNLLPREEAYLVATGSNNVPEKDWHPVLRKTVRTIQQYRLRTEPSSKKEFFVLYDENIDLYIKDPALFLEYENVIDVKNDSMEDVVKDKAYILNRISKLLEKKND